MVGRAEPCRDAFSGFAHAADPCKNFLLSVVLSVREAALSSDHFLVYTVLSCNLSAPPCQAVVARDRSQLQKLDVKQAFMERLSAHVCQTTDHSETVQGKWRELESAFRIAEEAVPFKQHAAKKPWIRHGTQELISQRQAARAQGNHALEKSLNKATKKSAKTDRGVWLDALVEDGSWTGIRKLKQPRRVCQGRLRDLNGELVSSESRADTMAAYLETVQWRVRPAMAVDAPVLGPALPVSLDSFSVEEVTKVIRKLRNEKAPGPDGIPAEYLKSLLSSSFLLQHVTDFLSMCWLNKEVSSEWHLATVTAIHKKGQVDLCQNYRPISLLNIWYKVFAALVHGRLVDAGAEARLSTSQFGFRSGRSTLEAVFVLRRRIDVAWAQKSGQSLIMALDWAKAFDAIDPQAMLAALHRFGLPSHVLEIIGAIYSGRRFQVQDCGETSAERVQHSGISQGCPLSPFLFVMIMSVLMVDAVKELPECDKSLLLKGDLSDLLYADDTLLLSVSAPSLERFLEAVSNAGATYGLELH